MAFSLPAARGEWLVPGLVAAGLGMLAWLAGRPSSGQPPPAAPRCPRLMARARAAVALAFGLLALHPLLSALQLGVAGYWAFPPGRGRWRFGQALLLAGLLTPWLESVVPVAAPHPGAITLVTLNAAFPWEHDRWHEEVAARLSPHRVDLVVVQDIGWARAEEIPARWRRKRVLEVAGRVEELADRLGLPHRWSDVPIWFRPSPHRGGTAVLSRWPLRVLPGTESPPDEGPGPALLVGHPDGELVLAPVHVWNPIYTEEVPRRAALAEHLARLPADRPRIVAGDTNLIPWERADLPSRHGFTEAARVSPFYGGTWPWFLPLARLDAVFVSPELEVGTCRVLGPLRSDHRPVLVRLRRRQGGAGRAPADPAWTGALDPDRRVR